MKVLWLCNVMLPVIAEQFHREASNKEGWLSGLADVLLESGQENGITLEIAFPAPADLLGTGQEVLEKKLEIRGTGLTCYGFWEDTVHPDRYDPALEKRMETILAAGRPDVIHCFGTEYPHTLAMCRANQEKERLLITIQGLCSLCAKAYYADLPEKVIRRTTFRDLLRQDNIVKQRDKFIVRGRNEIAAIQLAGNIGGRTAWDRHYAKEWNPQAYYFEMRETLRSNFYEGRWSREGCEPHSIFLSQGDYPIKGLHYMLLALPELLKDYPDTKVYVAGDDLTAHKTWKQKLKLSSYGKYLLDLIRGERLEEKVVFLGRLNSQQMKEQYLKSHLFVCPSSIENSPNSLGEAMLLGMPCVAAEVGGIPSIFTGDVDGVSYRGFQTSEDGRNDPAELKQNAGRLRDAILRIWSEEEKTEAYCAHAAEHALLNHDREKNYRQTVEVYCEIAGRRKQSRETE